MKYVALLRGVNVGGKRRVPNAEFHSVLKSLGFNDIVIYINSGNAVFASDYEPSASIVQAALEAHFGFTIPTLVVSGDKMRAIADAIPVDWTNDSPKPDKSGQKSDVLYLFGDINSADVINVLGHKPEIETMIYVDGAVIANITRANQTKGSVQRLIGTKLYSKITIRNITTAKKLADLTR